MNQTTEYLEFPKANREYKSTLFCKVFEDKKHINYGHNKDLLNKCRRLEEYAIFVAKVRRYATEDIEKRRLAITRAINECIEEGILVDILKEQKAEVLELVLTTFNRELYEQGLKEEATKEANEKILDLTQQLKDRDKELKDRDKELAELKAKLAEFTNK